MSQVLKFPAKGSKRRVPLYLPVDAGVEADVRRLYEQRKHIEVESKILSRPEVVSFQHRLSALAAAAGAADGSLHKDWIDQWRDLHREIAVASVVGLTGVVVGEIQIDSTLSADERADLIDQCDLLVASAQAALRAQRLSPEDSGFFGSSEGTSAVPSSDQKSPAEQKN